MLSTLEHRLIKLDLNTDSEKRNLLAYAANPSRPRSRPTSSVALRGGLMMCPRLIMRMASIPLSVALAVCNDGNPNRISQSKMGVLKRPN